MLESCCCFDLRTGGFIIGYGGLVLNFFEVIRETVNFITVHVAKDSPVEATPTAVLAYLAIGLFINSFLVFGVHKVFINL